MTDKYEDLCGKKWRSDWSLLFWGDLLTNRHFLPPQTTDTVSTRSNSEGSHKTCTAFFYCTLPTLIMIINISAGIQKGLQA